MKKLIFSLLLLTGCQTAGQLNTMSQAGMGALSCNQITAAFRAYEADRYSMDAWVQMVKLVNPELDARAVAANTTVEQRYQQARTYANLALAVQGCTPL